MFRDRCCLLHKILKTTASPIFHLAEALQSGFGIIQQITIAELSIKTALRKKHTYVSVAVTSL